jgi:hypothetical protein
MNRRQPAAKSPFALVMVAVISALVGAAFVVGCGDEPPPDTFCGMWLDLADSARDALLDDRVRSYAAEGMYADIASEEFVACMSGRMHAEGHRVTEACEKLSGFRPAPPMLNVLIVQSASLCAGSDVP